MSAKYLHQQSYAHSLAMRWIEGDKSVREVIRTLKNKAQASYIAAYIMAELLTWDDQEDTDCAERFLTYLDPNNRSI